MDWRQKKSWAFLFLSDDNLSVECLINKHAPKQTKNATVGETFRFLTWWATWPDYLPSMWVWTSTRCLSLRLLPCLCLFGISATRLLAFPQEQKGVKQQLDYSSCNAVENTFEQSSTHLKASDSTQEHALIPHPHLCINRLPLPHLPAVDSLDN